MPETNLVSVKELALKLKVSDALLKKFIRDFSIPTERIKKLIHVSNESVDIVKEIIRLRDSGKKNKEIKELFDQSRQGELVEKAPEEKAVEAAPKEKAPTKKASKAKQSKEKPEQEDSEEKSSTKKDDKKDGEKPKSKTVKASKKKKDTKSAVKPEKEEEKSSDKKDEKKDPTKDGKGVSEEYYQDFINDQIGENEADPDIQAALSSEDEEEFDDEEEDDDDFEEEAQQTSQKSTSNNRDNKQKRRRRQFSFRYIQRQIANDNKRINYIRHKLSRGKLSVLEQRHLEDSLDKRSKLLHGWMQLLRWVKA